MRASTAWLIAAAVILSGVSGCSGLSWSSAPKVPSLSSLNPMKLFNKKKTPEQLADNSRPPYPSDVSDAARGSVPRVGGQAPAYQPPEESYSNSAGGGYPSAGAGNYGSNGAAGSRSPGGSYAGPSGSGDFYRQERTRRDDYASSIRGDSPRGGRYANLDSRRDDTQYAGSGDSFARREQPIPTAGGRNDAPWEGNSGVQTNGTQYPLSPAPRHDRYGSSSREDPRSYDGGATGSGEANRWSNDGYDSGSQPRQYDSAIGDRFSFDKGIGDRFNKGGDSYGRAPSTFDSSRGSGYDDPRYSDSGSTGQYGSAAQLGTDTGATSARRLAPYRTNTAGHYTPGSTGTDAGAARSEKSSSGVMLTGGTERLSSYNASPGGSYDRGTYTDPSGGASQFQSPAFDNQRQYERSSAPAYAAPVGSSTRDYDTGGYDPARTATGSASRWQR